MSVNPVGNAAAAMVQARGGVDAAGGFTAQLDPSGALVVEADVDAEVTVDVTGYFTAPDLLAYESNYWGADASVVVDTATGVGTCDGTPCTALGAGSVEMDVTTVAGYPTGGVSAVTVSVFAYTTGAGGVLRVNPNGAAAAGELRWDPSFAAATGQFTVPVTPEGTITVETNTTTQVVVVVSGWWQVPVTVDDLGTGLTSIDPIRLVDTRNGTGTCNDTSCATTITGPTAVTVAGQQDLPADTTAVVASVTVHDPATPGTLTLSDISSGAGPALVFAAATTTATVIVPVDPATGHLYLTATTAVDVTIDIAGYFTQPASTWTYTYGTSNIRTAKQRQGSNPKRTEYTWTATGGLPLLLAEHTGTDTTRIVYGPGGIPLYQTINNTNPIYYHQDHQGSTRLVTNPNGTARGTLTYNAYGKLTENTINWLQQQPLLTYTGQYTDNETGYTYLRNRYYDPNTAQFTTQDPLTNTTREPYGYTNGNPTNNIDPLGLCSVAGVRIGFMSEPDGGCKGSGAVEFVKEHGDEVAAAAGGLALVCAPFAWTSGGAACVLAAGTVSTYAQVAHSVTTCGTDGFTYDCRVSLTQTGISLATNGTASHLKKKTAAAGWIGRKLYPAAAWLATTSGNYFNTLISVAEYWGDGATGKQGATVAGGASGLHFC